MRARRALGVLLAGAIVVLTACAPASRADWRPPTWEHGSVHAASPVAELDAGAAGPLAGRLVPLRLRNDVVGIQARVALLPDSATTAAFNGAVSQLVRAAIEARAAASGAQYAPTAAPVGSGMADRSCVRDSTLLPAADILADPSFAPAPGAGTTVLCGIVAASGAILGQRVRVVSGTPDAIESDVTTIVYADLSTGEVSTAEGLWAEGAAEALGADIVEALRRDAGALSRRGATTGDEAQTAAIRAALTTSVPAQDGFVITVPAGFVAPDLAALGVPATTEPVSYAVPAGVAAGLVTPFGARVLAAIGQPYAGPEAAAAGVRAVDCTLVPCVALTYDDGPSSHTPAILDALAERDSAATFFALGSNARAHADTLARMTREGHEVEGHTWNHPRLPDLSADEVRSQIVESTRALEAASGQRITAFRPPYGEFDTAVLAAAGMPAILWDVDTHDWQRPADDVLVARAVEAPEPGSIVLLHDIHPGTARTAGAVIDGLRERGFSLVTVKQLFGGELPTSGAWRSAR